MTIAQGPQGYISRPSPSGLVDVMDLILEKGLVIDVYVRVSLVGIELVTIDARIVVASVDTYLRFAEAVNRLDLKDDSSQGLPELVQDMQEGGARHMTKGALEGVKDSGRKMIQNIRGKDDEDEEEDERDGGRRRRSRRDEDREEAPHRAERPRRRHAAAGRRERER